MVIFTQNIMDSYFLIYYTTVKNIQIILNEVKRERGITQTNGGNIYSTYGNITMNLPRLYN
jgi:hypothetical protein